MLVTMTTDHVLVVGGRSLVVGGSRGAIADPRQPVAQNRLVLLVEMPKRGGDHVGQAMPGEPGVAIDVVAKRGRKGIPKQMF